MTRPAPFAIPTALVLVVALAAPAWCAEGPDPVPAPAEAAAATSSAPASAPALATTPAGPTAPESAATESGPGMSYGTRARLLEAKPPAYPAEPRMRGQEGWVQLSFRIRADGTVADPIVEDSTGIVEFERAAIKSILKARYAPATWQGKPIEQCASSMLYRFSIAGPQVGARREFIRPWKEAANLAKEQRYAEAEAKLHEIERNNAWSNYEIARMWLLRSSVQAATGDKAGQLRSLRRATAGSGGELEKELYRQALLQRFSLEVQLAQFGAALVTSEEMRKLKPPLEDPRVTRAVADIDRVIHGQQSIAFPGVIEFRSGCEEGRPNWKHELLRRTFAFDIVEGNVDEFELRCDWRRIVDKVSTEKTWQVPASWGWCQVFVFGEKGAKVQLVELPLAAGEEGARPSRVSFD